ncbi:MAG: endonuclease, partial [Parcubacteria group bacterium SW_4_46_8]
AVIGGDCLQLFSSSPRTWAGADLRETEVDDFKQAKEKHDLDPVVFHAPYLINLADRGSTGEKSVTAMVNELDTAARCGIIGSVVHVGSYKTDDEKPEDKAHFKHLIENIQAVLDKSANGANLYIENMGTRKIGKDIEQIARIIDDCGRPDRLKVCLDTCHMHAAGIDLSSDESYQDFFSEFDDVIGLDRLGVIHVNDSKDPHGSLRDRHENIGEGSIPESVFTNILTKKPTKDLPLIIETPGFDENGPDQKNLDQLRSLLH